MMMVGVTRRQTKINKVMDARRRTCVTLSVPNTASSPSADTATDHKCHHLMNVWLLLHWDSSTGHCAIADCGRIQCLAGPKLHLVLCSATCAGWNAGKQAECMHAQRAARTSIAISLHFSP